MAFRADSSSFAPSWARFFVVCGVAFALVACGGGGGTSSPSGATANSLPNVATTSNTAVVINSPKPAVVSTVGVVPTPQVISTPSGSATAPDGSSVADTQAVPVQFTYTLASATPSSQVTPNIGMQSHTRGVLSNAAYVGYTSTAAPISISLNVTPVGGSTSNYTGSCTAAASGTSGTCTVTGFTAAPGPTTIAGTVTESGNTIASFSNLTIIQPSTVNSINFTANPVVASVAVVLSAPYTYLNTTLNQTLPAVHAGTAYDVPVAINAYDANGKVIAGTKSYVDSTGTPISLILSVKNSQAGGRGTVYLKGPSRITAPGQAAIYAHYDGNWLDYSTISVTATSSAVTTSGATATLTTMPYATEYPVAGSPHGIVAGPDGNLWFAEFSGNAIGKITPTGSYTGYACAPCNGPHFITVGPDGNIWFTEYFGSYVDKITTAGLASRVLSIGGNGVRIRTGPDGNLWYSSDVGALVGKLSPNGRSLATYTMGAAIRGIGFGPDGNIWFTEGGNSTTVGHISLTGTSLGTATVSNLGSNSDGIVIGPDGNLWITNDGSAQLDKVTPAGGVTAIALQAGAAPRDIVVGPDGKLWFTEQGTNTIGVIAPGSTTPTEFTNAVNGISSLSSPVGITVGPDGNIWFAEYGSNTIAKFVL